MTAWAQVAAAVFAVLAAITIPLTAYRRRPDLELTEQDADRHSRVEGPAGAHLRLFVANGSRRRAAQATRVLVEGYRPLRDPDGWISLSHPSLGWPSAIDAGEGAVTLYSGSGRPIGLGIFARARRRPDGTLVRAPGGPDGDHIAIYGAGDPEGASWHLILALQGLSIISDDRDKLPAGEWVIRLLVGANDGDARRYDVHVAWRGDAVDEATVLAESLDRLHVERVKHVRRARGR